MPSAPEVTMDAGEHCHFYFRQHWIRLVTPCLRTLLWTLATLTVGYIMFFWLPPGSQSIRRIVLLILLGSWLLSQLIFLARFYRHFLYVTVVTDRRIHRIKKTLLTHDEHQTVDLWMLQDIHKWQRGPVQNILKFGSLTCEAQESTLKIHFVPRIGEKYNMLAKLKEHARMRMNYAGISPLQGSGGVSKEGVEGEL